MMPEPYVNIRDHCRMCGRTEPEISFRPNSSRSRCKECHNNRQVFLKANPSSPRMARKTPRPLLERIYKRVQVDEETQCWNISGVKDKGGYAHVHMSINGEKQTIGAHRAVAHIFHGLDLDSRYQFACHRCDNPGCVNPDHIFVGTPQDNIADCISKGRFTVRRGEANSSAKISEQDVLTIRKRYADGETQAAIAEDYSMDQTAISMIVLRKNWAHVA